MPLKNLLKSSRASTVSVGSHLRINLVASFASPSVFQSTQRKNLFNAFFFRVSQYLYFHNRALSFCSIV